MPSLQNRRIQGTCNYFIQNYLCNYTWTPNSGHLSLRSNKCNLRGKKRTLPRTDTSKYGQRTIWYYGPKMWNSLQDELRTAPTIKNFVSQIRKITTDACNCYLCFAYMLFNLLVFISCMFYYLVVYHGTNWLTFNLKCVNTLLISKPILLTRFLLLSHRFLYLLTQHISCTC